MKTIKAVTHEVLSEHSLDDVMQQKAILTKDIVDRVAKTSFNWAFEDHRARPGKLE